MSRNDENGWWTFQVLPHERGRHDHNGLVETSNPNTISWVLAMRSQLAAVGDLDMHKGGKKLRFFVTCSIKKEPLKRTLLLAEISTFANDDLVAASMDADPPLGEEVSMRRRGDHFWTAHSSSKIKEARITTRSITLSRVVTPCSPPVPFWVALHMNITLKVRRGHHIDWHQRTRDYLQAPCFQTPT